MRATLRGGRRSRGRTAPRPPLWSRGIPSSGRPRKHSAPRSATAFPSGCAGSSRTCASAPVAALGVNAVGVAVMLAVFIQTAGLTGIEVGIAAGTAVLNQKLLEAIFGEGAMAELVGNARGRLDALLSILFDKDRARFEALVPPPAKMREIATGLRTAVDAMQQ